MKYNIPTLMALSQETGVVCNWTKSAQECRLVRPRQGATPVLKESLQNGLAEEPTKSSAPVKVLPPKTRTRRGHRAKRPTTTAPAITFAPSEAGFAQFLKRHSSPKHQRVTAGGRIVPMAPKKEERLHSGSSEEPPGQPAATRGPQNESRDMPDHLSELTGQAALPGTRPWLLASAFRPEPNPGTVAQAEALTEVPTGGLLPGFSPVRGRHANADLFIHSLQQSASQAGITMNRMNRPFDTPQGEAGGNHIGMGHIAHAAPGIQNAMGIHPLFQMVPVVPQHGIPFHQGFYPTAQIAPIAPKYAMGVGHMAQSYAAPQNIINMHSGTQMMPVGHQHGMGFYPASPVVPAAQQSSMNVKATLPAQMAPIAQRNIMDVRATSSTSQMAPHTQQRTMGVKVLRSTSAPMQGTAGGHRMAETRPAVGQTGTRLNPTAPEFIHRATVQEANPALTSAPLQGNVQTRAIVDDETIHNAAPVPANMRPSWPPATPPFRPLEIQVPFLIDPSALGPPGRLLTETDRDRYATVLSEIVSLIPQNTAMPIEHYEKRLLFLVNLIILIRGSEDLHSDLLKQLRRHEERLNEKLIGVNKVIALFELNSRQDVQLQNRPHPVSLRVYWSLARSMTVRAIEHLEQIGRVNAEQQSAQIARGGGGGRLTEFEDLAQLEGSLTRAPDPEITTAESQLKLAPSSSDNRKQTDEREQNLNHRHSNMETGQNVVNLGENGVLEPHESEINKANEASQPGSPGRGPQPLGANVLSPGPREFEERNADQAIDTIRATATEGDTSPRPFTAGSSFPPSTGETNKPQAADKNQYPGTDYDADVDMFRTAKRGAHSQLLICQLADGRRGGAPVPRAVSTTAVSHVHAFDGELLQSPDGYHG